MQSPQIVADAMAALQGAWHPAKGQGKAERDFAAVAKLH
jgi:hypothetical protein